jgi:hypothetical protein
MEPPPEERIHVVARLRGTENKRIKVTEKSLSLNDKEATFDRVFSASATQEEIYAHVKENYVLPAIDGYSTSLITYGSSKSGKSYTMHGTKTAPGILPRALADIFKMQK